MTERKKYGEGLEALMIQSIKHHLWNMVEPRMASSDDVTEDRSSPEEFWSVYRYTFCPGSVKRSKVD